MLKQLFKIAEKNKKKIGIALASAAGMAILYGQISGPVDTIDTQSLESNLIDSKISVVKIIEPVQNDYIAGVIGNYVETKGQLVTAYELCIEGQSKIVVASKEELELVLELVQHRAVGEKAATNVVVTKNDEGLEIATSVIQGPELKLAMNSIGLSTSSIGSGSSTSINKSQISLSQKLTFDTGFGNIVNDVDYNEKVNSVEFGEAIQIDKVEIDKDSVISVEDAVAILNSTNVEPTTYTVEKGDSPYEIALDNDMDLDDLYALNEELEEKAKGLQVGDEVIIMVPEPELSVVFEETLVYYDMIPKEYVYVDDDTIYETVEEIGEHGLDGTKEVTAIVKFEDGEEISREIISESTITDQSPQIVLVGTKPLPFVGPTGFFAYPLSNFRITSYYGARWGGFHKGVDFATSTGTTISAADGGTVTKAGWSGGYGYLVEIDHGNGMMTRYAHCSSIYVSVGQVVGQHEAISAVGSTGNSTGPHLHFEILINGNNIDPLTMLD